MKTVKEMIEVMQAYERGEKIEFCYGGDWREIDLPSWSWGFQDYRVKQEPKFVPFDTAEEFFAAQRAHGINIVHIGETLRLLGFVSCKNKVLVTDLTYNFKINVSFCDLLHFYIFADGTPCGKEVKE